MTTLSAVVQLIDAYNQRPAVAVAAQFRLDGQRVRPLPKPQAFYAFIGLSAGEHQLEVTGPGYFEQRVSLQVPLAVSTQHTLADGIVTCQLEPSPLYPFPAETTLVRGRVHTAADHEPLSGVAVLSQHRDARDRERNQRTFTCGASRPCGGTRYEGSYVIALRGRLNPQTTALLRFEHPDHAVCERQIQVRAGRVQFLDIEM